MVNDDFRIQTKSLSSGEKCKDLAGHEYTGNQHPALVLVDLDSCV